MYSSLVENDGRTESVSTAAAWRRTQAFSTLQTLWILFLAEEEKADTVPAYEYEDNAAVASADATFLLRIMVDTSCYTSAL